MHIDYRPTWVVTITSDELRLIGKALSGRLKTQEDKEAALALNVEMCHSRLNRCDEVVDVADKALRGAWKLLSPEQEAALRAHYELKKEAPPVQPPPEQS